MEGRKELTGVCYPVDRNGKLLSLDISDMEDDEVRDVLKVLSADKLINTIITLIKVLKKISREYEVPDKLTREEKLHEPTEEELHEDKKIGIEIQKLISKEWRTAEEDRQLQRLSGIYFGRNIKIRKFLKDFLFL